MQKFRRIAALIGAILLIAMYVMTLVFALMGSPASTNLLMASIVCTVVVPVFLYAMQLLARVLNGRGVDEDDQSPEKKDRDKN